MRQRLAALAALSALALTLSATPALAAGSPITRVTGPAAEMTDGGALCGYQITGGFVTVVFRTADLVDGEIEAAHLTFRGVVAERDGASFRVEAVEIYNDLKGHLTLKARFISQGGGVADSINVVFRAGRNFDPTPENPFNGALVTMENDSCHMYG